MSDATARPLGPSRRSFPPWLWAALALSAIEVGFDWIVPASTRHAVTVFEFLFLEWICLAAIWHFARAGRRQDFSPELRRSLRWMTAPIILQALQGFLLLAMMGLGSMETHGHAWANVPLVGADTASVLSIVAIILALFQMPRAHKARRGPVRSIVDALTFVVGAGVPLWVFSLRPLLATSANADEFFTALGPLVSFGGLLTLSWALETRAALPSRAAVRFLLTATALLLLTDIMYSVGNTSGLNPSLLGKLNDVLLVGGFCLWLVAGWRCTVDPPDGAERRSLVEFSPLPLITIVVGVGFFVLLIVAGKPQPGIEPKVLVVIFLFLIILLLREIFVIHDSLRLVAAGAERKIQARYEALVRHSSDVVIVVGVERKIRFVSFAARSVLGIEPNDMIGRDLLDFIAREDRDAVAAFLDRTARDPSSPGTIQWRFSGAGDEARYLESAASNQLNHPEIGGIVMNSRDVSERRTMEEQLRQTQRMDAVGQLAGGIAHDFNNMLTAMLFSVDLLLQDEHLTPEMRSALHDQKECVHRAAALTRQLLLFSRRQAVQKRPLDLDSLLANLLKMLRRLVGENIGLEFRGAVQSPRLVGDAGMLEQMFTNLVVNARDAMPDGGRILLATRVVEVAERDLPRHRDGRPGRFLHFSVADSGCGMDAPTLARLFEPFFTTKPQGKGTGLGLATVYGIVKEHAGWIEVESAVGRGSTFHVYLPIAGEPEEPPTLHDASQPLRRGTETVLLVEDEPAIRRVATVSLQALGYQVHEAGNGEEALRVWAERGGRVDVLITDMVMPGTLTGAQLAERLCQERPGLPAVIMSGYNPDSAGAAKTAPGNIRYASKPFEISVLAATVRELLDRQKQVETEH